MPPSPRGSRSYCQWGARLTGGSSFFLFILSATTCSDYYRLHEVICWQQRLQKNTCVVAQSFLNLQWNVVHGDNRSNVFILVFPTVRTMFQHFVTANTASNSQLTVCRAAARFPKTSNSWKPETLECSPKLKLHKVQSNTSSTWLGGSLYYPQPTEKTTMRSWFHPRDDVERKIL